VRQICTGVPEADFERLRALFGVKFGHRFPCPCDACGTPLMIGPRVKAALDAGGLLLCPTCASLVRRDWNVSHLGGD
jgi:hypothetical protein